MRVRVWASNEIAAFSMARMARSKIQFLRLILWKKESKRGFLRKKENTRRGSVKRRGLIKGAAIIRMNLN